MNLLDDLKNIMDEASKIALKTSSEEESFEIIGRHGRDDTRVVDKVVEDFIVSKLLKKYRALIITEERGRVSREGKLDYVFVVDPLDGSYNFIKGIPFTAISIAVAEYSEDARLRDVFLGVVRDVFRGDFFAAVRGEGVYVNGELASVRKVPEATLVSAYFDEKTVDLFTRIYLKLNKPKVRTLGSAALELCYTSIGTFNAFIDVRYALRAVDISAGVLVVREMGGTVLNLSGEKLDYRLDTKEGISLVASLNKTLAEEIVNTIKGS